MGNPSRCRSGEWCTWSIAPAAPRPSLSRRQVLMRERSSISSHFPPTITEQSRNVNYVPDACYDGLEARELVVFFVGTIGIEPGQLGLAREKPAPRKSPS